MKYICIACNEQGFHHFYNHEKVLLFLLKLSNEQKNIFIYKFISHEIIMNILMKYKDSNIEINNNSIYYKEHYLNIFDYYIETDDIHCNLLFEYLKRFHKIWCCIDEQNDIKWINACKII